MRWSSVLILTVVVAGLALGLSFVDLRSEVVAGWLAAVRSSWWSPVAVAALFSVLAFLGAPQVVLIAAVVLVFGPWLGAAMAWISTLVSALVGFGLGRFGGAELLQRWSSKGPLAGLVQVIRRGGAASAFLVRLIPTGPFIMVNAVLGASGIRLRDFVLGTSVGIVPKIVLVAGVGHGLVAWVSGQRALAVWLLVGAGAAVFIARRRFSAQSKTWREDAAE